MPPARSAILKQPFWGRYYNRPRLSLSGARDSSTECFPYKIPLNCQLPNLGMQFLDLCFMGYIIALCFTGKYVYQPLNSLLLPVAYL
jgi:hypothetical protein